jgi:hypothetical protein
LAEQRRIFAVLETAAETNVLRADRRAWLGFASVVAIAGVAVLIVLLRAGGGPAGGTARDHTPVRSGQGLAQLRVPLDATERQWRRTVRSLPGPTATRSAANARRRSVLAAVSATGATLVRIRIWRRTSPAAVELVVATNLRPAVYLRHRAVRLVNALRSRPIYVKVVDRRGSSFFEWGGAANEGFVGVPPALQSCSPVSAWGEWGRLPCPVK